MLFGLPFQKEQIALVSFCGDYQRCPSAKTSLRVKSDLRWKSTPRPAGWVVSLRHSPQTMKVLHAASMSMSHYAEVLK